MPFILSWFNEPIDMKPSLLCQEFVNFSDAIQLFYQSIEGIKNDDLCYKLRFSFGKPACALVEPLFNATIGGVSVDKNGGCRKQYNDLADKAIVPNSVKYHRKNDRVAE